MKYSFFALALMLATCSLQAAQCVSEDASAQKDTAISLAGFADAIHHWYNRTDQLDAPLYDTFNTVAIADNIVLYQRDNGGWPENKHPQRVLSPDETVIIAANKSQADASFDNRNIYPQITYLMCAYEQTGNEHYRAAALKGLTFTLGAQYANGGWPHSPGRADRPYGDYITFADEVMPGVLSFLRQVASAQPPFKSIPAPLRQQAAAAVTKGDALVLNLQVRTKGQRAIWAGQYHPQTLAPMAARTYELPALQTWESVAVVEYLMSIPNPSPEVIAAVDSAVTWFSANRIAGVRVEEFAIDPVRFTYHTARFDRKLVAEANAPGLWARFYDLDTSEPFFTNRDGSRVDALADVALERRSGYDWYGNWPAHLIRDAYPRWRATVKE